MKGDKLLICECGHTFNMRKWDRSDRQVQNSYQCYSSVRTGSYESRKDFPWTASVRHP